MYYLKYRPKSFSELFGLEDVVQVLQKALQKNQVAHAYIFTGPKGSGKTTTARILAKAVNCERLAYSAKRSGGKDEEKLDAKRSTLDASGLEPCNECPSCQAVNEGRFLDLLEIDAASNRGIDDIRSLREKIKLVPSIGRFKVYIIDEAHMLTPEAFNALLKTLEEPPRHAIFVLATTEYQKIPETIKSRCLVLKFRRGGRSDLVKKLRFICQKEGLELTEEKLLKIAELAEGGFRNAETLLEQMTVGEIELSAANLSVSLFLETMFNQNSAEVLGQINKLIQDGENLSHFCREVVIFLRRLLLVKGGLGPETLDLKVEDFVKLEELGARLPQAELIYLLERFLEALDEEKYSSVPSLPLELAVFDALDHLSQSETLTPPAEAVAERPSASEKAKEEEDEPGPKKLKPPELSLSEVLTRWPEVLKAVKPWNHSLEALLRSARPKEASGGLLSIEVFYKFHKEKLSEGQNLALIEKALGDLFNGHVEVRYVLGPAAVKGPAEEMGAEVKKGAAQSQPEDLLEAALEAFGS